MSVSAAIRSILFTILACVTCTANAASFADFASAVRSSNVARVRALLDQGIDLNQAFADGSTALAWAIENQNRQMTHLLLTRGAKVGDVGDAVVHPLLIACQYGDEVILDMLLSANANVNTARADGISAFAICAGHASTSVVQRMLAAGATLDKADASGQTPLMWAAANGRVETAKLLLAHGAQVNRVTSKGFTPLFFALKSSTPAMPLVILEHGGDPDYVAPDGTSIVQLAMYQQQHAFAARMIERGSNLAAFDRNGNQLLHAAVLANEPSLVELLLAKGANPNARTGPATVQRRFEVNFTSAPYTAPAKSPLLLAAENGSADLMRTLVAAGADATLRADDGTNVVLAAAMSGRLAALQAALHLAPDPNVRDASGQTPLHVLMFVGTGSDLAPMMRLLAEKGARPDLKNHAGKTPGDLAPDAQTDAKTAFAATFEKRTVSRL